MLPALVISKAVGYSTGPNRFDDLVEVGLARPPVYPETRENQDLGRR